MPTRTETLILKPQQKIVVIYVVIAALWIYFSDYFVNFLFQSPEKITIAQHVKGWFYVGFTGTILYVLIGRDINSVRKANVDLINSYEQTMRGWVRVMDMRHKETRDHTDRVTKMTVELARLAGIPEENLENIERGARLHDIGKIGIPDEILIKPGKLTEQEWMLMKQHPVIAQELVSSIDFLEACGDIPYCHHEKWDGSGYPRRLKGREIPIAARIFAVVDVWDALSFKRVYKEIWLEEEVLDHIESEAGAHFDPEIVPLFLNNYQQLKRVGNVG